MSRWRKRVGEAGAEELLKESIRAGLRLSLIKPNQLARVNVDTSVMEKHVRHPTDARLLDRAGEEARQTGAGRGCCAQAVVRAGASKPC
jgi:IS5 family transposase